MAGCMLFVFASLGEFVVVKVLDVRRQQSADTTVNYPRHFTAVNSKFFPHFLFKNSKIIHTVCAFHKFKCCNIFQRLASMEKSTSVWDYDSVFAPQPRKKRAGSKHLLQTAWLDPETLYRSKKTLSRKIDGYSRIIFPFLFLLFVVVYWPIVLLKKKVPSF